jgi:hypothetical protein
LSIYIDELAVHHNAWGPFKTGSCHMTADTQDELHKFALRLGLKLTWFQDHKWGWHYDLVPSRREKAVALGAVELTTRELCELMRKRRVIEPLQRGKDD